MILNNNMIKKVNFTICNKVIKKEDILLLSDKIFKKYSDSVSDHKKAVFNLSCDDNKQTAYTIENEDLRSEEITIDKKKIDSISMSFIDYKSSKQINLRFSREKKYANDLTVEGDDQAWVDSVYAEFTDLIDGITPQNNVIFKNRNKLFIVLSIWFAWIFMFISHITIQFPRSLDIISKFKDYFPFTLSYIWMGVYASSVLIRKTEKLWPNIEFDFGPEQFKKEKRNRKIIWIVISLFIIPLLMQIIFLIF